jgi:hypothetical protein
MNFGLSNIMLQLSTIRITGAMGAAAAKSRVGVLVAPDRSVRVDGIDLTFDATERVANAKNLCRADTQISSQRLDNDGIVPSAHCVILERMHACLHQDFLHWTML